MGRLCGNPSDNTVDCRRWPMWRVSGAVDPRRDFRFVWCVGGWLTARSAARALYAALRCRGSTAGECGAARGAGKAAPQTNVLGVKKISDFNYLRKGMVPRPGVEPGLRPRAKHGHYRPNRPNIIEVFDDRRLLRVGPFYPHL
jgi:hypothetical protein